MTILFSLVAAALNILVDDTQQCLFLLTEIYVFVLWVMQRPDRNLVGG